MILSKEALELAKMISYEIWEKYDDTHGYRSDKQKLNAEQNIDRQDSMVFFWQQFDPVNQNEFIMRLKLLKYSKDYPASKEILEWIDEWKIEELLAMLM